MHRFFHRGSWVLLFHLQSFAGGSITLSGEKLQPVISVGLDSSQVKALESISFEKASAILSLHLVTEGEVSDLPVYGNYTLKGLQLDFVPLYRLGNNLTYEVHFQRGSTLLKKRFTTPGLPAARNKVKVQQIYPISDTIPVNALFFHVRFSNPMMQAINAWQYISILDEHGNKIEQTWRQHSFWLDSGQLLVLMVHPGRVKTGIHYIGSVFEPGKKYTLKVNPGLKDAAGNLVKAEFSKDYFITEEDRTLPQIVRVEQMQRDKTIVALSVTFSEGMDHASLVDGIRLTDDKGEAVPAQITQPIGDRSCLMTPTVKLHEGRYRIQFKSSISDFAANRLNRPFEITSLGEKQKDSIQVFRIVDIK